jgi:K(+)-stimulated pyrophosphate-energized sodium pump
MDNIQTIVLGSGVLALAYGVLTGMQVMSASAGNARMKEIAAAVQEGASAYLNRQYATIGVVGLIVALILGATLGKLTGVPSGLTGALTKTTDTTATMTSMSGCWRVTFSM